MLPPHGRGDDRLARLLELIHALDHVEPERRTCASTHEAALVHVTGRSGQLVAWQIKAANDDGAGKRLPVVRSQTMCHCRRLGLKAPVSGVCFLWQLDVY